MSEDRDRLAEEKDEPGTEDEDVEAHKLFKKDDQGEDDGDDVEAHVLRKP